MSVSQPTSDEAIRLFVGVPVKLTPALSDVLSPLSNMGRAVRAVRESQLHITLKFLGDADPAIVPRLTAALDELSTRHEAFEWSLVGTGAFPSPARPSVIWAGTDEDRRFEALANEIETAAELLGFERESRAFHAHLTLARVKFRPPHELKEWFADTAETAFGRQSAREIVLFQSELGRAGAVYTPLHVAALATPGNHPD